MEYKLKTDLTWIAVTINPITGLIPGTYEVRYKETENYNPSNSLDVVVAAYNHTCTLTPVAKVEPTHFTTGKLAHYKCSSCGKYYEDAAGERPINNINTWGIIPTTSHQLSDWKHDENKHWKECTIEGCDHKEQEAAHNGGTATHSQKAICEDCQQEYGETIPHNHSENWSTDGTHHWHECSCGDKKDVEEHVYNQQVVNDTYKATDATHTKKATYYYSCVCGKKGTTTFEHGGYVPHEFSDKWSEDDEYHWHECECGEETDKFAHYYTSACDETCDTCGHKRTITHVYYNDCDSTYNICGYERTVGGHVYTDDNDANCNHCGHERKIVKVTNGTKVENTDGSITVKANTAPEGKQFKGWKNTETGEIVSTEVSYTANTSSSLEAVYEDIPKTNPTTPTEPSEPTTPTNPDNNTPNVDKVEKEGLSGGAIAGIVIASVFVAGIGGFAIFWFIFKKKTFTELITIIKSFFVKK